MSRKDQRLYGKFTLDFPDHPKIAILSDKAFRCLVEATLWSRDQLTDGLLARRYALARWGLDVLQELCDNDDERPSLIETEKGWLIHDYAEHQDTKQDIEARRERNRLAGQKGGLAKAKRGAKRVASKSVSESLSENVAETETETETETDREHAKARSLRARPQRGQPTFTELLRGEPDPIPDAPPDDQGVRPVASTKAADLVRSVIPANRYPAAVLTDLRLRVGAMLAEGTAPELIAEALRLWDGRDGGPGLLPHLLADAAKAMNPRPADRQAPASRKVAAGLDLAARLATGTTQTDDHSRALPDDEPRALEA